jgi:hypothetical protein
MEKIDISTYIEQIQRNRELAKNQAKASQITLEIRE